MHVMHVVGSIDDLCQSSTVVYKITDYERIVKFQVLSCRQEGISAI